MDNAIKSDRIRLSVIDDHPIIYMGIRYALRKLKSLSIEIVNQYNCGKDVIIDLENLNSDVLLIDMCLPDIKGYELARLILVKYPEMKIGIYSNMLEREHILNAFRNGALGYLSKSADSSEIVEFILTIGRGERYVRGAIADIIIKNQLLISKNKEFNITRRESEVLKLIFEGYKNKEIAAKLMIAERTVEFHKQNLYTKLEVNNAVDLYRAALRHNLLTTNKSSSV